MSQQPRRRRRRRRGQGPREAQGTAPDSSTESQGSNREEPLTTPRNRPRRRKRGARGERSVSPASSEDLVRGPRRQRPARLTGPHDGQTLEGIIGDLQSEWGVPESPQEYRITLKIAEARESRGDREPVVDEDPEPTDAVGGPKRERAPAAPRIAADGSVQPAREKAPSSRRRGRRRRRGGSGSTS